MDTKGIKIVILSQSYLSPRAINSLRLDDLCKVFDVEYWDVSALMGLSYKDLSQEEKRSYTVTINNLFSLRRHAKSLPANSIVVLYTVLDSSTYRLHKIVSQYVTCAVRPIDNSTFWGDCAKGTTKLNLPNDEITHASGNTRRNISLIKRMKGLLYRCQYIQLMAKCIRYKCDYRYSQFKASIFREKILEGYKYLYRVGMDDIADYKTCSLHYDTILHLEENESGRLIENPYILFLDACYPMHQDWKKRVPDFDWDALQEPYFSSLNRFFDRIEKEYGCEVVIAAHPNTRYADSPYGNRKCIQYKSVELVKDAEAVMMHATGSVTFVSYYDKPFCFLTNDALKAGDFPNCAYRVTVKMAEELGMPLIDADHIDSVKGIFKKMNPNLRAKFLNLYFGDLKSKKSYSEQLKDAFIDIYNRIKS